MRNGTMRTVRMFAALTTGLAFCRFAHAETPPAAPTPSVETSVLAVSYGSGLISKAELQATELASGASGSAKFSVKQGSVQVSLSVKDLPASTSFGPEYLTYVAWAVSAEGRPRNLGEIVVNKGKGKLNTTSQIQLFGVAVTAEPYFAVGVPSELVVLRNQFAGKDAEKAAPTEVKFQTFAKSTYSGEGLQAPDPKEKLPLELYQARNAVRIAQAIGAETYADEGYTRATQALEQAEQFAKDKKQAKMAPSKAREAAQSAEAARLLATSKIELARRAAEKADADAKLAEAQASASEEARRRAEAEETAQGLRAKLLQQFSVILDTRDTARGLIVNLGDVLFDVNKSTLRPPAREKLAKLSGILLAHPGLTLEIEGHTDATGSDEYNQKLSEQRANSVRDFLVGENLSADAITAQGLGKTKPVASNDTAEGRQKNRRVEIVVSGDIIGTEVQKEKEATSKP